MLKSTALIFATGLLTGIGSTTVVTMVQLPAPAGLSGLEGRLDALSHQVARLEQAVTGASASEQSAREQERREVDRALDFNRRNAR